VTATTKGKAIPIVFAAFFICFICDLHRSSLGPLPHPIPRSINPERQQDRAYDHHTFHEDAQPGGSDPSIATHPLAKLLEPVHDKFYAHQSLDRKREAYYDCR